jgi:hypothetical protein
MSLPSRRSCPGGAACCILAVLFTPACGTDPSPIPVAVRDSAGVRIVEHGPLAAPLPIWTLHEPPEAIIGGEGGGLAHQLSTVVGAVRLSDGRIVVADALSREARYFDERGRCGGVSCAHLDWDLEAHRALGSRA